MSHTPKCWASECMASVCLTSKHIMSKCPTYPSDYSFSVSCPRVLCASKCPFIQCHTYPSVSRPCVSHIRVYGDHVSHISMCHAYRGVSHIRVSECIAYPSVSHSHAYSFSASHNRRVVYWCQSIQTYSIVQVFRISKCPHTRVFTCPRVSLFGCSRIQVHIIRCTISKCLTYPSVYSFSITSPSASHSQVSIYSVSHAPCVSHIQVPHIIMPIHPVSHIIMSIHSVSRISKCLFIRCIVPPSLTHQRTPTMHRIHTKKALMMIWFTRLSKCSAIILESMRLMGWIAHYGISRCYRQHTLPCQVTHQA